MSNNITNLFKPLKKLYGITDIILVESDIAVWEDTLSQSDLNSINYISSHDSNYIDNPVSWNSSSIILSDIDGEVDYYHLSNPLLSGAKSHEYFSSLWKNISTKSVVKKDAISLKTYLSQNRLLNSFTILVIDSFDGKDIVKDIENYDIPVVSFRILKSQKESYDKFFTEKGYVQVDSFEDNHPEVIVVVYSFDYKLQKANIQKELETQKSEKANIQKELETQKSEKANIQKELEAQKSEKANIQKELEAQKSEKQNIQQKLEETKKHFENRKKQALEGEEIIVQQKLQLEEFSNSIKSLQKSNIELLQDKENFKEKQILLEQELTSAEIQIAMVKELFMDYFPDGK